MPVHLKAAVVDRVARPQRRPTRSRCPIETVRTVTVTGTGSLSMPVSAVEFNLK